MYVHVAFKHPYWDKYIHTYPYVLYSRAVASGGRGGFSPPQFLAKQLTLSQPGGQIIPTKVLEAPPNFQTMRRACTKFDNKEKDPHKNV